MKQYSIETYKSILGMIEFIENGKEKSQWDLTAARARLFDIGSVSLVRTGNGGGSKNPVMERIERKDEAEAKNRAFSMIENLIIESFYCIDPEYRIYVYDLYFKPDRRKAKNSPSAEAERYGYDRRKFVPQLSEALANALMKGRVMEILNEIAKIAVDNDIEELTGIFAEEEKE